MDFVAHQAPLSMEFFKQEYWSRLPFLPPGDPPDAGIKPASPALADKLVNHLKERICLCWVLDGASLWNGSSFSVVTWEL